MHPETGKSKDNGRGERVTPIPAIIPLQVPLLSLVSISAIKIDNMTMEFNVGIQGFMEGEEKPTTTRFTPTDPADYSRPLMIGLGSSGFFGKRENVAKVKIEFKSTESSKAIMKINAYLIKSII